MGKVRVIIGTAESFTGLDNVRGVVRTKPPITTAHISDENAVGRRYPNLDNAGFRSIVPDRDEALAYSERTVATPARQEGQLPARLLAAGQEIVARLVEVGLDVDFDPTVRDLRGRDFYFDGQEPEISKP